MTDDKEDKPQADYQGRAMSKSAPAKPKRSRLRQWLPGLLFLVVLGVAGYLVWRFFLAPARGPDNVITLSGRIEGDSATLAPKLSGRILEVRVREGDVVNEGDTIAVLDDEQIRARENQARANLSEAEAKAQAARAKLQCFRSRSGRVKY